MGRWVLLLCGACIAQAFVAPVVLRGPGSSTAFPAQQAVAVERSSKVWASDPNGPSVASWAAVAVTVATAVSLVARASKHVSNGALVGKTSSRIVTPVDSAQHPARQVALNAHKKPTKKGRKFIILECTEQRQMVKDGVPGAGGPRGGVSRYYTEKNVRNTPELLELKKYNKWLGRHTVHRELK